ncbi:hypothetical protein L195_g055353 [Trifolium pratense]|uniref:Uncharacterized protein n=1 Tax=Trifolium pratense TaxID=57577 RepID=A0A2K3KKU0_TRIPR|nr:hypothetical protein L195_g055353 [Trifolium pratense]
MQYGEKTDGLMTAQREGRWVDDGGRKSRTTTKVLSHASGGDFYLAPPVLFLPPQIETTP